MMDMANCDSPPCDEQLARLSAQVRKDRKTFAYYARPWVKSKQTQSGEAVYDVLIAGAGQNGLGLYHGLSLNGIHNVAIIDKHAQNQEGNFFNYVRMNTLRTPKELVGMDFGNPNLTFQRYCEAVYGETFWNDMGNVPRLQWVEYLRWFRDVLEIPVSFERELLAIDEYEPGILALKIQTPDGIEQVYARSVILATGAAGEMVKNYPQEFTMNAPKTTWCHAADPIDFKALEGKRMAILGHGAGAFDVAGYGLEQGVAEVHLCFRRKQIPKVNPHRHIEYAGMMGSFRELGEDHRWMINQTMAKRDQPPPQRAYDRAVAHDHFFLHAQSQWQQVEWVDDALQITLPDRVLNVDFAVLATGFKRLPMQRKEIAPFADKIRTWEDYTPPPGYEMESYHYHPYTGKQFEYLPKVEGEAEFVRRVFDFSFGSALNMGPHLTSISGLNFSLKIGVEGIRNLLLLDDAEDYFDRFIHYNKQELDVHRHPGC